MKLLMVISFLFFLNTPDSSALVPLEGIIFGELQPSQVNDKFKGLLSYKFKPESANEMELVTLLNYKALHEQGRDLQLFCEELPKLRYSDPWQEQTASRSIVGTLQFVGMDIVTRSIAEFAKLLEMKEDEYFQLSENLVANSCSPNFTVYSHKTIRDNLKYYFKNDSKYKLPSLNNSPFFSEHTKTRLNTYESNRLQFHYALLNFRALCSWGGDEGDYRMLVPYLRSPVIMSHVFNNLLGRKIEINLRKKVTFLKRDKDTAKVACEDLICRKRTNYQFKKLFPRMIGSTRLKDDLYGLYCNEYQNARYNKETSIDPIKTWFKEMTPYQSHMEVRSLIALLTGIADPLFGVEKFEQVGEVIKGAIQERWDQWAANRVKKIQVGQLYEEPLELELVSKATTPEIRRGEFKIHFQVGLSEIDKVLVGVDKIDSYFNLDFESRYLSYVKDRLIFYHNRGDFINKARIRNALEAKVLEKIKDKDKYFKVKLSREDFAKIVAEELIAQLNNYDGSKLQRLDESRIIVPVEFEYGLFALQYIHQKFLYDRKEVLTFK